MAVIKNINELKPVIDAGKALGQIGNVTNLPVNSVENNDGWARAERILESVLKLAELAQSGNKPAQDTGRFPRRTLSEDSRGGDGVVIDVAPAKHAENAEISAPKGDEKMAQAKTAIVNEIKKHLTKCVAENPNMTLGESIDKIDLNVTQLQILLQMFSGE